MKSIKPGRGPSMMGCMGAIGAAVFGVIWTILAASMGGGLFALFGVVFVAMAIGSAIYEYKNATSKNRYSLFDITEGNEEPDPLNMRYNSDLYNNTTYYTNTQNNATTNTKFCPYCGTAVASDFEFCNSCGKKLP